MQQRERFDIVGKTKLWLSIAAAVMVIGLAGLAVQGLNLGLDFTGGALYQFRFPEKVVTTVAEEVRYASEVRSLLAKLKLVSQPVIQLAEGDTLLIRLQLESEAESDRYLALIEKELKKNYPKIEREASEFIGSIVGGELRNAAILGSILGLLGVSAWIWLRYQILGAGWLFAIGALVALAHDVLVLLGFVSWARIEINSSFIAALLTVAGYSVQDTVVIYDRIRENLRVHRGWALQNIVNYSLLQTLARSINTSLTTIFALWAVFLWGGVAVKPLALSLLFGIVAGTYSSIFIAAPLVLVLQGWWEARQASKQPAGAPVRRPIVEQRPILRPTTVSQPTQLTPEEAEEVEEVASAPTPTGGILRQTSPRPASSARRKHRKKKRR